MSLSPIAQAVVTDPGGGSAGYALVAASPGLAAQDAECLERSPGVSEYLHTKENPRPCFSFFQLPSGAWALSRRFVSGKRRGAFNRIVAHTLVLADDVLSALAEEPSLLTSHCTYRPLGRGAAEPLEFFQLGKMAADPKLSQLVDLSCQPPAALTRALIDLGTQRRRYLLRSFSVDELEERLAAVFGALEQDKNILLPQEPSYEELLRLAWSSLPPAGRRQVPWATHFAPGVRIAFRMLNAPNPPRAREQQAHTEDWRLVDQPGLSADSGAAALAAAVARDQPPLALRISDLARWSEQLRLFGGRGSLQRWLAWGTRWSQQIEHGCDSLSELRDLYAQVSRAAKLDPWIQASAVLRCTCHTIGKLMPDSGRYRETVDTVYAALTRHGLDETVLDAATLGTLSGGTFSELEAFATALALRALPPPPRGGAARESLFDTLIAELDVELGPVTAAVLLDLACELGSCRSAIGHRVVAFLVSESPASIDQARDRLAALPDPVPAGAMLVEALRETGSDWRSTVSDLVDDVLLPQLARREALPEAFAAELLSWTLGSASPESLTAALIAWRGEPYEVAVDQLRGWIAGETDLALQAVAGLTASQTLRPTARLAGVSLALARAGASPVHWMPFAVAEAVGFDGGDGSRQLADRVFMPLAELALTEDEAARCYEAVLAALSLQPQIAGRCHRLLFRLVVEACPRHPDETIRTFEGFFDAATRGLQSGAELAAWAPAIREARAALRRQRDDQQASYLVALWWQALARVDGSPPQDLLASLEWLLPRHRHAVVAAWLHRVQALAEQPGGQQLAAALQSLTRGDETLAHSFGNAKLKGEIHPRRHDLAAKLNELHQQVGGDPIALQELLDARALPSAEPERSFAVLRLLTSPDKLWPDIYDALETHFLIAAVEEVLEARPRWLMDVERLTAREQVLARVAKKLGLMARRQCQPAVEFLQWALDAPWSAGPAYSEQRAQRDLFIATLLASSEIARDRPWDLVEGLFEQRQGELLERLRQLASESKNPYLRSLAGSLKNRVMNLRGVAAY